MSRLFGLFIGILLAVAGFWIYSNFYNNTICMENDKSMPASSEVADDREGQQKEQTIVIAPPMAEHQDQTPGTPVVSSHADSDELIGEADTPRENHQTVNADKYWQDIWTPFRTQGSANGFAARIGQLTGFEMDVRKIMNGKYQVAFSYENDDEKQERIQLIEDKIRLTITRGDRT